MTMQRDPYRYSLRYAQFAERRTNLGTLCPVGCVVYRFGMASQIDHRMRIPSQRAHFDGLGDKDSMLRFLSARFGFIHRAERHSRAGTRRLMNDVRRHHVVSS